MREENHRLSSTGTPIDSIDHENALAADGEPSVTRAQDVTKENPPVTTPVTPNPLESLERNRVTEGTPVAGEEGSPTQQSAEKARTTGFFENEIQRDFKNLSESLTNFRYSPAVRNLEWAAVGTQPTLPPDQKTEIEKQINTINRQIYLLNITLYHFASCFDKKHQTENGCK
jgi:hypothetical protein